MSYFSRTFNTNNGILDRNLFSVDKYVLYNFLDCVFYVLSIEDIEYSFASPKNIIFADNDTKIRVFVGNEKAIDGLNLIRTFNQKEVPNLEEMNKYGTEFLGFKLDLYFDLDKSILSETLLFTNKMVGLTPEEKYLYITELNPQDTSAQAFFNAVKQIRETIVKQLEKRGRIMKFNSKFRKNNITVKKDQAFYILPFKEEQTDFMKYLKGEFKENKIDCKLVKSEDIFIPNRSNDMVENIWEDICSSCFVIADLSDKNPNVFYELGICDAIGKTVISICSKESYKDDYKKRLPFDVSSEYTIFYGMNYEERKEAAQKILNKAKIILNQVNNHGESTFDK